MIRGLKKNYDCSNKQKQKLNVAQKDFTVSIFFSEIITQISILMLNNGLAAGIYIKVSGILYHNINLKNRLVSMVCVR